MGPDGGTARVTVRAPQVVARIDRVARAAAAVRDRRAGGGGLPAPAPDGRDQRPLRGRAASVVGPPQAAISHQFADLEDGYGFLIECPHHTTGLAAAAGRGSRAARTRSGCSSGRAPPRSSTSPGTVATGASHRRLRERGSSVPARGRARHPQLPARAGRDDPAPRGGGGAADRGPGAQAIYWERGDDLDRSSAGREAVAGAARARIFRAPDGDVPDGTDPRRAWRGRGESCTTSRECGSATRARSRPRRGTNPMITIMALAHRTPARSRRPEEPTPAARVRAGTRGAADALREVAQLRPPRGPRVGAVDLLGRAPRKAGEQLRTSGARSCSVTVRVATAITSLRRLVLIRFGPITARSSPVGWIRTHSVPAARTRLASLPSRRPSRGGTRGLATHAG